MIFTRLKKTIASKNGWKKLCRKLKKTDNLQQIANLIRVLRMHDNRLP
ncbi:hypothetical protein HMPREF0542_12065 [Ligilactobacillus ruminis ATCC 25644]|uniref:Uncharacterized protein n=1 Tax=Ligilactobacillus ruminis ATCC 25644 TaxID=525362 RepID=E7FT38_9LACO|nr:hypothetical protein HMPREF0542_12065 [Ligilactobacillus ruminis ATCC 25644]